MNKIEKNGRKRLNEIYIGAHKIEANVARYQRKENENRTRNFRTTSRVQPEPAMNTRLQGRSFVDVVKGTRQTANIESGKSSKVDDGPTPARKEVERCPSIQLKYLGGLKMLLEFENTSEKVAFMNNGKEIWQPWFKEVNNWDVEGNFTERIASIIIQGVPQHALCEEAFNIIARSWGSVLFHQNLGGQKILPDKRHEDIFESLKLSPVLAANDFYQRMSWWDEDSTGDNGSLNSDVPDHSEASLQSPRISSAKS
ncbi:unnamed protein product [Lactuca saligna]|uniref:Uncharacterized protein n=1 Tax=Lactuca saligna TaxID=75948 RepID=A0AA35ZPK4_LACSI|nr:unnamed protein product [Lactuca saligna]